MSLHFSFEATITSTSCNVGDAEPSEEVRPQPVTVAAWSVYMEWMDAGRQIGEAEEVKVMWDVSVNMATS